MGDQFEASKRKVEAVKREVNGVQKMVDPKRLRKNEIKLGEQQETVKEVSSNSQTPTWLAVICHKLCCCPMLTVLSSLLPCYPGSILKRIPWLRSTRSLP